MDAVNPKQKSPKLFSCNAFSKEKLLAGTDGRHRRVFALIDCLFLLKQYQAIKRLITTEKGNVFKSPIIRALR